MNGQELPITTLLICGLGAWGCSLLLSRRPRRTAMAVAAFLLAAILARFPLAGNEPLLAKWSSWFPAASYIIPGGCGMAAAILVVTSRGWRNGFAWYVAAVLANSALLVVGGAVIAGVTNVIVNVGLLGTLLLSVSVDTSPKTTLEPGSRFRWLPCAVVGLLLAALLPSLTILHDVRQTPPDDARAALGWRELGHSLLFEHGVSLTVTALLLFVAMVAVARMTLGEPSEAVTQATGGPAT